MDQVFGIELIGPRGPNTVKLGENDIYHILEDIMGLVPEEDVEVIQMQSPHIRRIDVATTCLAVWRERDLFQYMDHHYDLGNGKQVFISRPYEELTVVKVKRIPSWWRKSTEEGLVPEYKR